MKTAKQLIDELSADGMTQGQIAGKTGITQATISRIQSGVSEGRASNWHRLHDLHTCHFSDASRRSPAPAAQSTEQEAA
ncbi:helix-turn-helix domain-containing protein [Paraburkholderia caribensis]|uniref:helix-turn-helix domain-containing protein n=1 Tax=Paraburkholderia caribensis TaxID=75105 RepID=UPI001CAFFF17|nr:helix-turn-helix transcriptional regulator [Paraburkholderia caribensis]CAG9255895.1 conserved hypothetical protein [Paraburkholderia caribensis]